MSSNAASLVSRMQRPDTARTRPAQRTPHTPRTSHDHRSSLDQTSTAGWSDLLGAPAAEATRSRDLAHLGGLVALLALVGYLTWRVAYTLPAGPAAVAAWVLVAFEAVPLVGMGFRIVTLWSIDSAAPAPVAEPPLGMTVAVLIPTYDEPAEVIAPTIAAACAVEPAHETWVLDDGDRPWVEDLCREYGARYVCRPVHDHARAGNLNHALDVMEREATEGPADFDVVAVLDCDHVPLEHFLTATLGWFADPEIALVQGPQSFHSTGAFDGEQGLFSNVRMASRNHPETGPFWHGSTALVRTRALREIGGVSTATIVEEMHTTLALLRAGWRTAYHHQTLAVGLVPATADQYLLEGRRRGLAAMQVLVEERLWRAKRSLSWRNYYEYLTGTLWWLRGAASVLVLLVPVALLLTGAQTSTAGPVAFTAVFGTAFLARLWGAQRLSRHQLSWTKALTLRILRIPVGLSCLWWLVTRRTPERQIAPEHGTGTPGRVPRTLLVLLVGLVTVLGYAAAGLADLVPWRATPGATVASGAWLLVAATAVGLGALGVRTAELVSPRRNAHRFAVTADVTVDGYRTQLVEASVDGVLVRLPSHHRRSAGLVELRLPGAAPVQLAEVCTEPADGSADQLVSLRVQPSDWAALRTLSLWLFHTPRGAVRHLRPGVPVAASTAPTLSPSVRHDRAASARVRTNPVVLHA